MSNNKIILSLLFILCFANLSHTQTKEQSIRDIRKKFALINTDSSFTKITMDNEEFLEHSTCNGAEISGFFKGDDLKRVELFVGKSNGVQKTEYYYWNNKLFFVYQEEDSFYYDTNTGVLDYDSVATHFEGRYYFADGKLIENKLKGELIMDDVDKINPNEIAESLLKQAKEYADLLETKKQKGSK